MSTKVLRIIARLNIGGPARNAVLLTEGLDNKGKKTFKTSCNHDYETVLICGKTSKGEGDMMYLAREKGLDPIIIKELRRELLFKDDWRAFWKIYRIICNTKPDIIHTHTAKAGTLGRLAGILYNLRVLHFGLLSKISKSSSNSKAILVHTFHGHVLHSYFGRVKTLFFIWVEKILALFTNKIVTVSESLEKELVERFAIAPKKKFSVVELGFELGELLRLSLREKADCINVGITGRLVVVKNHKMLFRVARKIKDVGIKAKFIVVGDGKLRKDLEYYARELDIDDIVEFKGWIRDLYKIYGELDIMTLTSLNEGTPVSIIEAMAAGRPVVVTKVGGLSDIVQDRKSGYVVDCNDEVLFTEKLLDLINDFEKRKRFGEYGRELVKDRFSKERLIKDIDTLYNSLLKERIRA